MTLYNAYAVKGNILKLVFLFYLSAFPLDFPFLFCFIHSCWLPTCRGKCSRSREASDDAQSLPTVPTWWKVAMKTVLCRDCECRIIQNMAWNCFMVLICWSGIKCCVMWLSLLKVSTIAGNTRECVCVCVYVCVCMCVCVCVCVYTQIVNDVFVRQFLCHWWIHFSCH